MKRGTVQAAALLGAMLLISTAKAGVVISNFDTGTYYGGTQGWFNYDGMPYFATQAAPTGGSTNWLAVGLTSTTRRSRRRTGRSRRGLE